MSGATRIIPVPALMLVTDRTLCPLDRLPAAVASVVQAGVNVVQVREKNLAHPDLVDVVRSLRDATLGRALLFVNGDIEAALEGGADGVQLGETALPVEEARRRFGSRLLIGRSVHDEPGARDAAAAGADLLVLGTIFPSRSHPGGPAAGPALVKAVTRAVSVPVVGIGGITDTNAAEVLAAGASGIAVISAILAAPDPALAAAGLRRAIDRARAARLQAPSAAAYPREHQP